MTYEGDGSTQLDLTVGSFDDPYRWRPTGHAGAEAINRPWLDTYGLPEKRTDELPNIVAKWMEACGQLPD
ncbi:hypothetical protein [uncultured Sphingomonas sp.]|uniref:hypothetical protein n=1 Tax=uncultured Sphingomonas sp. TaxID=158754 RepID=UPI0035C979C3